MMSRLPYTRRAAGEIQRWSPSWQHPGTPCASTKPCTPTHTHDTPNRHPHRSACAPRLGGRTGGRGSRTEGRCHPCRFFRWPPGRRPAPPAPPRRGSTRSGTRSGAGAGRRTPPSRSWPLGTPRGWPARPRPSSPRSCLQPQIATPGRGQKGRRKRVSAGSPALSAKDLSGRARPSPTTRPPVGPRSPGPPGIDAAILFGPAR